jgi:hypothetical protein
MTQSTVEKHLLKVGASRYQDPDFRKAYPEFSPISRFGIGILSTFMIADSVEITTCHPAEAEARRLSLRSVHGKYLVRRLRKEDATVSDIFPHGTRVDVAVRPSADVEDVLDTVRKWVVVPACPISVTIGARSPVRVGFGSPREYLRQALTLSGIGVVDKNSPADRAIAVDERRLGEVTLAYAIQWSETFREWSFVGASLAPTAVGTCIEGIRVEFDTPGFSQDRILALANAVGRTAPKTNVARSGLEATPERDNLFSSVYTMYCQHVAGELASMEQRGFSQTWAAQEAEFLLGPLVSPDAAEAVGSAALEEALANVPAVAVEGPQGRSLSTVKNIREWETILTTEWPLARSAEWLIAESQGSASLGELLDVLGYRATPLPSGVRICNTARNSYLVREAFADRQIAEIACFPDLRRVDIEWGRPENGRWIRVPDRIMQTAERILRELSVFGETDKGYHIPKAEANVGSIPDATAIITPNEVILVAGKFAQSCRSMISSPGFDAQSERLSANTAALVALIALHALSNPASARNYPMLFDRRTGAMEPSAADKVRSAIRARGHDASTIVWDNADLVRQLEEAWTLAYDPYARSRLGR